jgi:hypothetical protein
LSLASAEVLNFTTPDLLRLLYAVLILGRFFTGPDAPLLDTARLRAQANLHHYLNEIVDKLRNILADMHNPPGYYLVSLTRLFEDTKKWYGSSVASMIAVSEDLFAADPLQRAEKAKTMATECCVDIPDGSENCPDFESVWDRTTVTSDPVDTFINWEDNTA